MKKLLLLVLVVAVAVTLAIITKRDDESKPDIVRKLVGEELLDYAKGHDTNSDDDVIAKIDDSVARLVVQLGLNKQRKIPYTRKIQPIEIIRDSTGTVSHRLNNQVLLASNNAKVGTATNSIIIAQGDVNISFSGNNIVISGGNVDIAHDRDGGSLVLSKGKTEISHATASLIYALGGADVAHARGSCAINTRDIKTSHGKIKENYSRPVFSGEKTPVELAGASASGNCFVELVNIAPYNPSESLFSHFDRLCYQLVENPGTAIAKAKKMEGKKIDPDEFAQAFEKTIPGGEGYRFRHGEDELVLAISPRGVCAVSGESVNQKTLTKMIDNYYAVYKAGDGERNGTRVVTYRYSSPDDRGAMLVLSYWSGAPGDVRAVLSYLTSDFVEEIGASEKRTDR